MARYSQEHKDATRRRIIETAGRRFKQDGIDGSGIATLMADAGLTNGAFYAHFDSKDDLVATVVGDEIGRCSAATKKAYTDGAQAILDEISARLAPEDPGSARGTALSLFTMLVGAMQLSRALADKELSDAVLAEGIQSALTILAAASTS
jgi:AcrR family transcriptional regulator